MSSQTPNLAPKPETEDVHSTYERTDNRWDIGKARRDWIILAVLVVIYLMWAGIVYLIEPGIR